MAVIVAMGDIYTDRQTLHPKNMKFALGIIQINFPQDFTGNLWGDGVMTSNVDVCTTLRDDCECPLYLHDLHLNISFETIILKCAVTNQFLKKTKTEKMLKILPNYVNNLRRCSILVSNPEHIESDPRSVLDIIHGSKSAMSNPV